jgi:hypothetical protein
MKSMIITVLIVFGIIMVVGLGSVFLVLWAYGAGQVMLRILPEGTFSPFEATLLNQVGVLIMGIIVIRAVSAATSSPISSKALRSGKTRETEKNVKEEIEDESDEYMGIPRWRQPLKKIDFTGVKPNDPCPCGSGRKFKSCHGYKRSEEKPDG